MGNKKNRNPGKKLRKRLEKQQQATFSVQSSSESGTNFPMSNDEKAKKYFDEGFLHLNKGFTLVNLDKNKEAIECFDSAIECYTNAIELLGEIIKYDKNYNQQRSHAYNNRGIAYFKKDNYTQAIKDYSEALNLNPKNVEAYCNRGMVYLNKEEYDLAIKDCTESIRINPNYVSAYNYRGDAYAKKGEHDKAVLDFNKTMSCDDKLKAFNQIDFFNMKYIKKMQDKGILPNFDKSFTKEFIVDEKYADSLINIDREIFSDDADINKVLLKIEKFDKRNISHLDEEDIRKFIIETLQVDGRYYFAHKTNNIPSGSSFYRVRKLDEKKLKNKECVSFEKVVSIEKIKSFLSNEREFWACPKNLVDEYGRLHKPKESVLYTTLGYSFTPMYETNITEDDLFLFIKYKSRNNIEAGIIAEYEELDPNSQFEKVMKIYSDFYIKQFRKEVNTNKEYILTNIIKDLFFNDINVLAYPSIKNETTPNVAFSGEKAQAYLALDTVLLCSHARLEPELESGFLIRGSIEFSKNKDIVFYNKPDYEEFERIVTEFQK